MFFLCICFLTDTSCLKVMLLCCFSLLSQVVSGHDLDMHLNCNVRQNYFHTLSQKFYWLNLDETLFVDPNVLFCSFDVLGFALHHRKDLQKNKCFYFQTNQKHSCNIAWLMGVYVCKIRRKIRQECIISISVGRRGEVLVNVTLSVLCSWLFISVINTVKLHAAQSSSALIFPPSAACDTTRLSSCVCPHEYCDSWLSITTVCLLPGSSLSQMTWRGSTSGSLRLSPGIPQGSVLSPLLHSLYHTTFCISFTSPSSDSLIPAQTPGRLFWKFKTYSRSHVMHCSDFSLKSASHLHLSLRGPWRLKQEVLWSGAEVVEQMSPRCSNSSVSKPWLKSCLYLKHLN